MPEIGKTLETTVKIGGSTAMERFERERMPRRQALRKLGVTTTMSVLALLTADDLARMAAKALKQIAGDNAMANRVASEFAHSGIALAATSPCNAWENPSNPNSAQCSACNDNVQNHCNAIYGQATCDTCAAQASKFCATGNYNSWWNVWDHCGVGAGQDGPLP